MTALSTIAGMVPVAIGLGAGSESRAPMGACVVGGMMTSTLLTLVVIPVVYSLVDDTRGWIPAMYRRLFSWRSTDKQRQPSIDQTDLEPVVTESLVLATSAANGAANSAANSAAAAPASSEIDVAAKHQKE